MDLWKVLEEYGPIADIYIPRKLAKNGRKFAFVRFLNVKDEKEFEGKLKNVWMGNFHLFVAIAKFGREEVHDRNPKAKQQETGARVDKGFKVHGNGSQGFHNKQGTGNKSFASLFSNHNGKNVRGQEQVAEMVIDNKEMLKIVDVGTSVLAKVRDINLIENLPKVCVKEGFKNVDITYMGGSWVWIDFASQKSCVKFKQNQDMHCYFTKMEQLSKKFVVDDRAVWVEIEGLPLCAWSAESFRKIAGLWGEVLFVDSEEEVPISVGRVCIRLEVGKQVKGRLKVSIEGVLYDVQVKEAGMWIPDIDFGNDKEKDDGSSNGGEESDEEDDNSDDGIFNNENLEEEFVNDPEPVIEKDKETSHVQPEVEKTQEEEVVSDQQNSVNSDGIGDQGMENSGDKIQDEAKNKKNDDDEFKVNEDSGSKEAGDSSATTPSRPPGFGKKNGSKAASVEHGGKKGHYGNKSRRASFSVTSALKEGRNMGVNCERTEGRTDTSEFSLIANMSRFIEIGNTLGHDMEGVKQALTGIIKGIGEKMVNQ